MAYNRYAGIDSSFRFPPQVMKAVTESSEMSARYYTQAQIDRQIVDVLNPSDLDVENLNDVLVDGFYIQTSSSKASTDLNYPIARAGLLEVISRTGEFIVFQRYTTYDTNVTYLRSRYSTGWFDWRQLSTTLDLSNKSDKGHTHAIGEVNELESKLSNVDIELAKIPNKSDKGHTHAIGDVDGLDEALALAGVRESVLAHGAIGDGVADDTDAFTSAFATGKPVYVPGGIYKVSGARASGPVDISMDADAVIQHDSMGPGILIEGSETPAQTEAGIPLSQDVVTGDTNFFALDHGLSEGDYFRLGSELPWDASSTNIRGGEILRVATASGSGFTSTTPVMGGPYSQSETAAIWRLNLIEGVTIRGGTIRGPRTSNLVQTGLLVRLARDVEIVGTRFEDLDYRHVSLEDVVDGHVVRTDHDWAQDAGMAYGVAVTGACQNITISRSTFVDTRHAVTTSNLGAVRGITRYLTVSDCVVRRTLPALNETSSGGDAFDTHTAADHVVYERNIVEGSSGGGINVECTNSKVRWNTIIAPVGTGIHIHNESDHDGSTEVIGNLVVAGPETTYGIRVSPASRGSGKTLRGVIVNSNTIKGVQTTPIYMGNNNQSPLYAVSAHSNVFIDCPGAYMIRAFNLFGSTSSGNVTDGGKAPLRWEDHAPTGDDPGFEYGRFVGDSISVTPTGRYIQLTGNEGDTVLRTITGASRGQHITLIAPLNKSKISIETGGNLYPSAPLSIAGRETAVFAFNGITWSEVNRSLTTVIGYDTDGVPYLEGV